MGGVIEPCMRVRMQRIRRIRHVQFCMRYCSPGNIGKRHLLRENAYGFKMIALKLKHVILLADLILRSFLFPGINHLLPLFQGGCTEEVAVPIILRQQRFQAFHALHAGDRVYVFCFKRLESNIKQADFLHLIRLSVQIGNIMEHAVVLIFPYWPGFCYLIALVRQFHHRFHHTGQWRFRAGCWFGNWLIREGRIIFLVRFGGVLF